MDALPDDGFDRPKVAAGESLAAGELHTRLDPELSFAAGALGVDVHPGFFAREEQEAIALLCEDRGAHGVRWYHTQAARSRSTTTIPS